MSPATAKIDRFFLISVMSLTILGFVIFLSAALGLLARDGADFGTVAFKQALSLFIGIGLFWIFSKINYHSIRKFAFFILLGAVAINALLFIPGLSFEHGGAVRWINLGFVSFQPSELLKIAFVIYVAAWAHFVKDKIATVKFGLMPYIIIMSLLSILLLAQSDTDTLVVIGVTGITMFFISGMKIKHITISIILLASIVVGVLIFRPYTLDRVKTFLNRGSDAQGSGYQINQSLIAIGSGGLSGRGFGQSVQKFGYIPEPIGDSIFAVTAEEFGFIGSLILIGLYVSLVISAFRIGVRTRDIFGSLLAIGVAILITVESFMNIGAMLGLFPLFGMPLLFVSHGGTALIIILVASGIVANVSKYSR